MFSKDLVRCHHGGFSLSERHWRADASQGTICRILCVQKMCAVSSSPGSPGPEIKWVVRTESTAGDGREGVGGGLGTCRSAPGQKGAVSDGVKGFSSQKLRFGDTLDLSQVRIHAERQLFSNKEQLKSRRRQMDACRTLTGLKQAHFCRASRHLSNTAGDDVH